MFQSLSLQLFILDSLIGNSSLTFFVSSCFCVAPRNLSTTLNLGQEHMKKNYRCAPTESHYLVPTISLSSVVEPRIICRLLSRHREASS
uniref:Secreted protein n=1 Tax=Arundo donax TaxID=35708 RepID=A0A0A9DDP4_ARUDO